MNDGGWVDNPLMVLMIFLYFPENEQPRPLNNHGPGKQSGFNLNMVRHSQKIRGV